MLAVQPAYANIEDLDEYLFNDFLIHSQTGQFPLVVVDYAQITPASGESYNCLNDP